MVKNILKMDWILLAAALLLLGLSLAVLYPISHSGNNFVGNDTSHFFRQAIFAVIGIFLFLAFSFTDYRIFRSVSSALFLVGIFLLFAVLVFGKIVNGTSGWISFGVVNFQPVEIFKLIIAVVLAKYFSLNVKTIREPRHIFISLVPVALSVALIMLQPDLGSALVIVGTWAGVLLLSGVKKRYLIALVIAGLLLGIFSWHFVLKDYQKQRIMVLVSPTSDPHGAGYNVLQSTVAVGSGGVWGKGLGHGSQSQLNFLPEKHTDFIFAVIAEELGFTGVVFVLILLFVILMRLFSIARESRDNFGKLLVGAVAIVFFIQIIVNIGMNIGIAPVAGIPLPLLSYGGSSLVATCAMLGIAESVYRGSRQRYG
ncbi:MAG TPA: rod shape-determining protein RodA [Candidatus Saccharimonadales bacterium]|nr:rod shape-determining protein RodA [Candidatus Saccharimonadales bacterium]